MLSRSYGTVFERMLEEVAVAATELDVPLAPFWPIRGAAYDGSLLVIGRSVNGWIESWTARELRQPDIRRSAVERMRSDAEPADRCRMQWVTDLAGPNAVYNTNLSAFWRVLRRIVLSEPRPELDDAVVDWLIRVERSARRVDAGIEILGAALRAEHQRLCLSRGGEPRAPPSSARASRISTTWPTR